MRRARLPGPHSSRACGGLGRLPEQLAEVSGQVADQSHDLRVVHARGTDDAQRPARVAGQAVGGGNHAGAVQLFIAVLPADAHPDITALRGPEEVAEHLFAVERGEYRACGARVTELRLLED